jgi:phospholipase C
MQVGTNTNRLFLFSATNDPAGTHGGPSINNSHDTLPEKGGSKDPYRWTTYAERLTAAGVPWRVYQDLADNFGDNSFVGFKSFQDSLHGAPGADPRLARDGLSTYTLERLKADVMDASLPPVSWVVGTASGSEHPGPSSPAQGADYIARVLDALTANPKTWARTVFLVNFDENDGFFDHMPPPAPPSRDAEGGLIGASTVDLTGEHHLVRNPANRGTDRDDLMGRPYGLGPRVPMYVVSPWSRGGWVNSQVADHTSVIRFLEARFGVMEPNISPWRRAVCGDLTSAFDFKTPNREARPPKLPATAETAARAAALRKTTRPPIPGAVTAPVQAKGVRLSRPLPYELDVRFSGKDGRIRARFANTGRAGAVFHAYDLTDLAAVPRRYTVGAGQALDAEWPAGADLWVLGPNGFHRRFRGQGLEMAAAYGGGRLTLELRNAGAEATTVRAAPNAYGAALKAQSVKLEPGATRRLTWPLSANRGWYDLTVTGAGVLARVAGRVETGRPSISDPAMGGTAVMSWS